ncbi:MAG: hypothetical protein M3Q46_06195 [Verrucomicrobiota bacterium]|nr:hypothetical protein [Verrucomicrobiota bacterium]
MKPLFIVALAFLALSCAENPPPAETVREHFERGISGEGQIVPLDRDTEPNLNPPVTQAAPTP